MLSKDDTNKISEMPRESHFSENQSKLSLEMGLF
jgi:hypothetical protein